MLFKKKWISYIIWIVAMVSLVIMAAQYAFLVGVDILFASEDGILYSLVSTSDTAFDIGLLGWILVFLLLCVAFFFIGRGIALLIRRKVNMKDTTLRLIKILISTLLFIGCIAYRGYMLYESQNCNLTDLAYYDAAAETFSNSDISFVLGIHGASYVYVAILSFFMQFLGIKPVTVFLVQTVIQIITVILVFGFGKRAADFGTGYIAAAVIGFIPMYTNKLFEAGPECFVAMYLVLCMYMLMRVHDAEHKCCKVSLAIVTGLITGLGIYLDASIAISLIVLAFTFIHNLGKEENRKETVLIYLLVLLSIILGTALSFCVDGSFTTYNTLVAVKTWLRVTLTNPYPSYTLLDSRQGMEWLIICMIMVGGATMTLMGFVRKTYEEYEMLWVLMFACAITPLTMVGYLQGYSIALIVYALLMGAGIMGMLYVPINEVHAEEDIRMIDKVEQSDEKEFLESSEETETEEVSENTGESEKVKEPAASGINIDEPVLPTTMAWADIKDIDDNDIDIFDEIDIFEEEPPVMTVSDVLASLHNETPETEMIQETEAEEKQVIETEELQENQITKTGMTQENQELKQLVQVDDLPGMIPNPLPLPTKKAHTGMDFSDGGVDEDDYDYEVDDDDDFDI